MRYPAPRESFLISWVNLKIRHLFPSSVIAIAVLGAGDDAQLGVATD